VSFRWLLAAALITASGTASANEAEPAAPSPEPEKKISETVVRPTLLKEDSSIETENYTLSSDGSTIIAMPDAHGNPVLFTQGARLEASRILFNQKTKSASAEGEVKVDFAGLRILADGANYRSDLRRLETGHVRLGKPPILIESDKISVQTTAKAKVDTSVATLDRVKLYYNEPDFAGFSISASRILYDATPGVDKVTAEDVVFRVGPVPIMYLPSWSQEGMEGPPLDPEIQVGSNNRIGAYARTTTFYTANPRWQPGLLLDGYGKAGVLAGPAFRYDTAKGAGDSPTYNLMKGDLRTGFIEDTSSRGVDQFGNPVPKDRHFVEWKHKQTIDDTVEVTAMTHWWSDPLATRDFRRKLFNENQQPDNFVEVVYPDKDFYGSVFARYDPNGFWDINQRLPEARLDLNPREISDTRIYQRGYVSVGYLREQTSDELTALPGTLDDTLATPRVDAYYGLSRPITPNTAFTLTPVAGARSTTWFDAVNGDPTYSRLAGQVGFDAQSVAQGKWDYDNTIWEVNGLRHQLRPVVQYRYLPGATEGANRIPQIDRWSFLTAPPPIDLSQRRDTDELHETQVLRLGFENLFQTRDKEYGSRDLIGVDVYQDVRETDRAGDRTLSDTYIRQKLTPAKWLDLQVYERISPYSGALHELSTQTTIADGDRWAIRLGTQHVTDALTLDQYMLGWSYRIDSQYALRALWRYDADTGVLAEQTYGVTQQIGHTWQLEYLVSHNRNARDDSGYSFSVRVRLATF
jgi:LPS-assembly protein